MRQLSVLGLILLSTSTTFAQKPEPQELDGNIEWVYDYEQGKLLSETTRKPMFVVFRCER